jgi:hypothetical protein
MILYCVKIYGKKSKNTIDKIENRYYNKKRAKEIKIFKR